MIKPEFWTDIKMGQESESVMLTFIGLWNFSDDYGVVKANTGYLKGQIYPFKDNLRNDVFSKWLERLVELEVIIPFTYKGESFYYIRTFRKHQSIDRPSKARNCPEQELLSILHAKGLEFKEDGELVHSTSTRATLDEPSSMKEEIEIEIKKKEEKGIPEDAGKATASPPSSQDLYKKLPKDFTDVHSFILENRPSFPEPYVDLWNFFAEKYGLAQIKAINGTRRAKLATRIKEPLFCFPKILDQVEKAEWLVTKEWFSLDWILKNEINYVKILEGQYEPRKSTPKPPGRAAAATEWEANRKRLELTTKKAV